MYLFFSGIIMSIGVTFFHSENPFYAGVGATLSVIFGLRWWYLQSSLNLISVKSSQLTYELLKSGYTTPLFTS